MASRVRGRELVEEDDLAALDERIDGESAAGSSTGIPGSPRASGRCSSWLRSTVSPSARRGGRSASAPSPPGCGCTVGAAGCRAGSTPLTSTERPTGGNDVSNFEERLLRELRSQVVARRSTTGSGARLARAAARPRRWRRGGAGGGCERRHVLPLGGHTGGLRGDQERGRLGDGRDRLAPRRGRASGEAKAAGVNAVVEYLPEGRCASGRGSRRPASVQPTPA